MNRRDFLKYAPAAAVTALLAREAILQTQAQDLVRQADDVRAFSGGPGGETDSDSFASLLSPIGASGTYLRSDGSKAAWSAEPIVKTPAGQALQKVKGGLRMLETMQALADVDDPDSQGWDMNASSFYNRFQGLAGLGVIQFFQYKYLPSASLVDIIDYQTSFSDPPGTDDIVSIGGQPFGLPGPATLLIGPPTFDITPVSTFLHGPVSTGAQVGLSTASLGTGNNLVRGDHRHAFSGRFSKNGFIRDASLGGATPAKFARIFSNNNWTVRRISVFALTAPAGTGNDAYGVVNAAGTLVATAVTLAVGANENATGLLGNNLTGGTVYYIAVTGRATTPALDVNVELEYTMNV